jgi:LacI family transcriptional regulator
MSSNPKSRPTIYEVASAAGVSRQTVSRVLNSKPDVSPDTRKRVQDIIEQLDYRPSAIARSLSLKKTFTLGVVTAGLKYLGPSRTLSGITREADLIGYGLLLKELNRFNEHNVAPLLQWFQSQHVDGIIWAAPQIAESLSWLNDPNFDLNLPIIFLTSENKPGISIVSIDNYAGGLMATEHLLNLGKQHIGHISGPLDWWEARQRKKGWEDALTGVGIHPIPAMSVEGNWSSKSGKLAFQILQSHYPQLDAVFVGNDQMALSILQATNESGIKIPEDLAVIGFDGIPESEFYSPPLSTIYQDQDEIGRTAVRELIRLVNEKLDEEQPIRPRQITLQPELVVRQSTVSKKFRN